MLRYDMRRLFEHPLKFRNCIPSAIVALGGRAAGDALVRVQWRRSGQDALREDELLLSWNIADLLGEFSQLAEEIDILRSRDEDRATQTELAAVVVAVAVLSHLQPGVQFTRRSAMGTRHDYYLNDARDEMVEIAGRREAGLPGLFEEKRAQSDLNPFLRKRWVSVTVFARAPRNRTEGLHP